MSDRSRMNAGGYKGPVSHPPTEGVSTVAQRTIVQFTDDLDGSEAEGTVTFGLDGEVYEIDLSADNAERLREAVAPYTASARKLPKTGPRASTTGRNGAAPSPGRNPAAAEARKWAQDNGIAVPERGRVPGLVLEAFNASKRNDDETLNRLLEEIDAKEKASA